jgi:hypothetical protein
MARNETDWLEIYDLPAFQPDQGFDVSEIYEWTEKLEKESKLRSLDLIRLREVIRLAYENGRKSRDD